MEPMEHTEQQPDDASFGTRVRSAVIWRSGTQILGQIISWGSTLVILRILDPSDYGLFAMTQVILAFLAFMNGYFFASSLIQADTVEPHQIRQAFGMLLIINCALACSNWRSRRLRRTITTSRWWQSCCGGSR